MALSNELLATHDRIKQDAAKALASLVAAKALAQKHRLPDELIAELTNAKFYVALIATELQGGDATIAAARMTGQAPHPQTSAAELPLHPANQEHERMLETLHRAGDHTLDPEDTDAAQRVPTKEEVAA